MSVSAEYEHNPEDKLIDFEVEEKVQDDEMCTVKKKEVFKKPLFFIGPRKGKTVGKVRAVNSLSELEGDSADLSADANIPDTSHPETEDGIEENAPERKSSSKLSPAQKMKDIAVPLPYKEPNWGGIPPKYHAFEVLKSGSILEKIDLTFKSFYVFGRLSTCDIHMAHPTVSRFHAILQYKNVDSEDRPHGFYIYDLGSTHGTFLNKNRIKPNLYVRMHVGHMLKLGGSSRLFILQGPEDDMEQESELTVTQLKEKRLKEKAEELAKAAAEEEEEEEAKIEEEDKGVDWGIGEDADEESDLTENPFAATQNEDLYIADPKKTLRGWFEREGYELEYDVEEKGFGQFLCRVELPIEAARGGTMVAEALVKGKKKESVVQCALEACRILDRYGLLRQATHESKKRKARNWEEEDFYDSDEDTFLDRTGVVEKKRMQRMQAAGKVETHTETYESLVKKHGEIMSEIQKLELELEKASLKVDSTAETSETEEVDALDAFMTNLSSQAPDKKLLGKLKSQLVGLRHEEARLRKLVNIARPASLPEFLGTTKESSPATKAITTGPMKRKTSSLKSEVKPVSLEQVKEDEAEEEEEEEEVNEGERKETLSPHNAGDAGALSMLVKEDTVDCSGNENKDNLSPSQESKSVPKEDHLPQKLIGPSLPPSEILQSSSTEKPKKRKRHKTHTKGKVDSEKCNYDSSDPAYSMWVPPEDQSGDGRTKLNEKYGY